MFNQTWTIGEVKFWNADVLRQFNLDIGVFQLILYKDDAMETWADKIEDRAFADPGMQAAKCRRKAGILSHPLFSAAVKYF